MYEKQGEFLDEWAKHERRPHTCVANGRFFGTGLCVLKKLQREPTTFLQKTLQTLQTSPNFSKLLQTSPKNWRTFGEIGETFSNFGTSII
jgi:hypothetical protein